MDAMGNIMVAIVDDDESICRSLGRMLGVHAIGSRSFHSAEELLADNPEAYDCIILDIQLAGMSGIELGEHLDATGSRVPVIFLTALDDSGSRSRALAIGCASYFLKTDPGEEIVAQIRSSVPPA